MKYQRSLTMMAIKKMTIDYEKKNENKNLALNTGKFFLGCLIGFDGRNK